MMPGSSSSSSWRSSATAGSEAQHCEVVCNMLAMLSCSEKQDAHRALLAMTNSPESCQSLRRAGCIPLLIQILHPGSTTPIESHPSPETKNRASKALDNIVRFNPDEQTKRKEQRILKSLKAIRAFSSTAIPAEQEKHPTIHSRDLMKLSFDADHKNTMCTMGAIHAVADLILADHRFHGPQTTDPDCVQTRRFSCMTLTNLTFGDSVNKALLCSMNEFLTCLVAQMDFNNEDIVQVTASVLRNLSWHADTSSKSSLRDVNAVAGITRAALRATKDSTVKVTLSALWNLSAHSDTNKAAICSTPNALQFLLSLLREMRTKSLTTVENAGGILRNLSSYISRVEEYRKILRDCQGYEILLENLKSSSFTVVSNACGTLWNLSGHLEEQRKLLELNAVPKLKGLTYSKNDRINQGASAALRNILSALAQPNDSRQNGDLDSDQPLDLTITSCKSSPIRKINPPPFLNPPLCNGTVSTRSCPDIQVKEQKMESNDETFNYSNYEEEEEEEEKHQQKDTVKTYCDEGTPGFSGSMVDLSNQTADTCIQFQVEDTPAVFSRTSSLSSIEENQHGENAAEKIMETKKASPVVTSGSLPNSAVAPKRVMFSAEETPLMFSRCSSVASLESCGDLNNGRCESDCVSEFSRRTSEVVSPSELPDSPRAIDHTPITPPNPTQDQPESDFIEEDALDLKANKPTSSANDEVKVFAMEGTPFLISTATSLSDIVGELDIPITSQIIPEEPSAPSTQQQTERSTTPPERLTTKLDSEEPIYSDVQLLQKCIKAGRGLGIGIVKIPPAVEEEEVDLSSLIQRGRAKLLARSEDNLKQIVSSTAESTVLQAPVGGTQFQNYKSSENGSFSPRQNLGSMPALNQNQRIQNINLNIVHPTLQATNNKPMDTAKDETNAMDTLVASTKNLKLGPFPTQVYSPNANSILSSPNGNETDKTDSMTTLSTVKEKENVSSIPDDNDNTDTPSLSEDTTWADETPTFSSEIPSMSINNAIKKVEAAAETLSEIEPPTLDSIGTTLDSARGIHLTDSLQRQVHQKQLLLLQTSSSQVSNLMNQKPPQEFFDMDSSMISVASIKSEIFEDGVIPSSPQLSHSTHAQNIPQPNSNTVMSISTNVSPPGVIPVRVPSPPQSKFDTFVIKRIDSPKERRKNDPDRYLTRTIEKSDLKIKPPVPPKPTSATSVVRPTRASELRATRSREHSPTNSTVSLNTTGITGSKIPPKPPVRSTPPLNTTLPRNAKLMEGFSMSAAGMPNNSNNFDFSKHFSHPSTQHHSQQEEQLQQQPLPPPPGKDNKGFGGRIGNLFRKSFSKDNGKKKDGSNIWVKRREKALVTPFNYKPPPEPSATITTPATTTSTFISSNTNGNATNVGNPPANNSATTTTAATSQSGNAKSSTKITTV